MAEGPEKAGALSAARSRLNTNAHVSVSTLNHHRLMDALKAEIALKRKSLQELPLGDGRPTKYMRRGDIERLKEEQERKAKEEKEAKKREEARKKEKEAR